MTTPEHATRFARLMLREWLEDPAGDMPGDLVQDYLVEAGLLAATAVTERCGDRCGCAEITDFPTLCYRLTRAGQEACDAG